MVRTKTQSETEAEAYQGKGDGMTSAPMIETEGRSVPEWIGRNADEPIPDRVLVRVFLRFNGICQECETKITSKRWVCDHRVAIINGGANRERNLGPIHEACDKKIKTPRDMKIKAKIYRIQKRNLGVRNKSTFACSRDSRWKKKITGEVVAR